jgi:hypothetical protein
MTWIATGNNVGLRGDIVRRINLVRLEPDCERPDARTGFRHNPLIPWVRANRGLLARAAMTILRAYCVAGRPTVEMASWGRFEAWSELVRGSLVWAGQPDPYLSRDKLEEADAEGAAIDVLFLGLAEIMEAIGQADRKSLSAAELAEHLADNSDHHKPFRAAIADVIQVKGAKGPTSRDMGYLLRKLTGKVRGGLRLCAWKSDGVGRYFLHSLNGHGHPGTGSDRVDRADRADPFLPTRARSRARAGEGSINPDGGQSSALSALSAPTREVDHVV